jgi:cation:H+ antiporter
MLAVADIAFGRGRLYRHIPVLPIVGQSALMLAVLAVPLLAAAGTPTVGPVSVATFVLPVAYLGVLAAIRNIDAPGPDDDADDLLDPSTGRGDPTKEDIGVGTGTLWRQFGMYALVLASAGVALEWSTEQIGSAIGLAETAAGALLAGVVTSLPELVTAVAAVRAGALDLATGDLVGSSALDVALLAYADAFYSDGTVFDLLDDTKIVLLGMAIALTTLLLIGLARRALGEPKPVAVESYVMLTVYGVGALLLITAER